MWRHVWIPICLLALAGSACEDGEAPWTSAGGFDDPPGVAPGVQPPGRLPVIDDRDDAIPAGHGRFVGILRGIDGERLDGVRVRVAGLETTSAADGTFTFPAVEPGIHVMSFRHPDRVTSAHRYPLLAGEHRVVDIRLMPRSPAAHRFSGASGGEVREGPLVLRFPPGALVTADGQPASGPIDARVTVLDPRIPAHMEAPPALLEGLDTDWQLKGLESAGMLEVELSSEGEPVEVGPSHRVTVTMDITGLHRERTSSVPMWHFSETNGLWVRAEGIDATVTVEGDRVFARAELPHFSAWNYDYTQDAICAVVNLDDSIFPPGAAYEDIEELVVRSYTGTLLIRSTCFSEGGSGSNREGAGQAWSTNCFLNVPSGSFGARTAVAVYARVDLGDGGPLAEWPVRFLPPHPNARTVDEGVAGATVRLPNGGGVLEGMTERVMLSRFWGEEADSHVIHGSFVNEWLALHGVPATDNGDWDNVEDITRPRWHTQAGNWCGLGLNRQQPQPMYFQDLRLDPFVIGVPADGEPPLDPTNVSPRARFVTAAGIAPRVAHSTCSVFSQEDDAPCCTRLELIEGGRGLACVGPVSCSECFGTCGTQREFRLCAPLETFAMDLQAYRVGEDPLFEDIVFAGRDLLRMRQRATWPGLSGDFDRDGIPNLIDNCRYMPNQSQADRNGDGVGDACAWSLHRDACRVEPAAVGGPMDRDGDGRRDTPDCDNDIGRPNADQMLPARCLFGDGMPEGDASYVGPLTGCESPECEACIARFDPYCVDTAWDLLCALQAQGEFAPFGADDPDVCRGVCRPVIRPD